MRSCPAAILCLSGLACTLFTVQSAAGQTSVQSDCAPILQTLRRDFAVDPGRLVLALEDALTTNESCACGIVRTAVELAGRDPVLSSEILLLAIRMLPHAASQVAECVLLEAPEAGQVLRAALARELGEKAPSILMADHAGEAAPHEVADGKQPAARLPLPSAGSPDSESSEAANETASVGGSGIYIVLRPGRASMLSVKPRMDPILHEPFAATKATPLRPVFAVTRSAPE